MINNIVLLQKQLSRKRTVRSNIVWGLNLGSSSCLFNYLVNNLTTALSTTNKFQNFYFVWSRYNDTGQMYYKFDETWFTNKIFRVADYEFEIQIGTWEYK